MKKALGTIILLLSIFRAMADGFAGYSHSETNVYSFSYINEETAGLQNYFVKEIARINYLNLYRTRYDVEFVQEFTLFDKAGNQQELQCRILPAGLQGDIYYESFDLSDVLIPSHCSFVVSVFESNDLLEKISIDDMPVDSAIILPLQTKPENENALKFEVTDFHFNYRDTDKYAFSQRISQINDWMAYLELSRLFISKVENIDPEAPVKLFSGFMEVYDLNRFWDMLNEGTAGPPFTIPSEHAAELAENKRILYSNVRRLNTLLERNADTLTMDPRSEFAEAAARLIRLQTGYLDALEKTHYYYEPVFHRAAGFFSTSADWKRMAEETGRIFHHHDFSPAEFRMILYDQYLRAADLFSDGESFTRSLMMLENAQTLCQTMPGSDCDLDLFNRMSRATYGIYDAYLRVSATAMENKNLEMASKYLKRAQDFQQENKSLILTGGDVSKALEELAWLYFEQGKQLSDQEEKNEALAAFITSKEIYRQLNIAGFNDILNREIEKLRRD